MGKNLRWLGGFTFFSTRIGSVNIHKLNRGKKRNDQLPDTLLLYDKYVNWGIIPKNQKRGGETRIAKLGVVYDTRDNEPNPMSGIWSEVLLIGTPSFMGNNFAFARIAITHRQYFTIKQKVLNLAYRLSYQGKIVGVEPYYILPEVYNSDEIREGLGGSRTLRGVLRNRAVGEDFVYGNVELRWKFLWTTIFNQNFYFALIGFTDFGRITGKYPIATDNPEAIAFLNKGSKETWHQTYGCGLYGAMNQNFVGGLSYGIAANPKDGKNGVYIIIDFLF
jgi:outer membrane protein assembly factor BamA